jgi:hypothetical protein
VQRVTEDAATALLRALSAQFAGFGGAFRVDELSSRSWASVTFSGARHKVAFSLLGPGAGEAADSFLATMEEAEFDVRGHIVADIALAGEDRDPAGERVQLRLEALTVEDV